MAVDKKLHFNYFVIDFNEELSAFHGNVLRAQVLFLYDAVERLTELYATRGRNKISLIIIGHSVGGVIARSLLAHPDFDASRVDVLVTLAAPHRQPVVALDHEITHFYESVNSFWNKFSDHSSFRQLTQLAIGGGFNDILVRSDLTSLPERENTGDISVVSTAIPDVWLPLDHLCIVWCRQFMIKLNRILFDIIEDIAAKRGLVDMEVRQNIVDYHFNQRTRGKTYPNYAIPRSLVFPTGIGAWTEMVRRSQRLSKPTILEPLFVLIRLVPKTTVVVILDGDVKMDWISACNVSGVIKRSNLNMKYCESGLNLSPHVKILPGGLEQVKDAKNRDKSQPRPGSKTGQTAGLVAGQVKRLFKQSADGLISQGFSHLNVWLTPTGSGVSLTTERYASGKRNKAILLPSIFQSLTMIFSYATILNIPVTEESSYYNLSMVGLEQVWHTYTVRVDTVTCYSTAVSSSNGLIHFHVPWSREDIYTKVTNEKGSRSEAVLAVNSPKPRPEDDRDVRVHLVLDPDCGYVVNIRLSVVRMLGQLVRYYSLTIVQFMIALLLAALSNQMFLKKTNEVLEQNGGKRLNGHTEEPHTGSNHVSRSLSELLRTSMYKNSLYGILPIVPFMALHLVNSLPEEWKSSSDVLKHVLSLEQANLTSTQFICLNICLFVTAYAFIYCLASLVNFVIKLATLLWLVIRQRLFEINSTISGHYDAPQVTWKPLVASILVLFTALATSSGVALVLALVLHLVQMFKFKLDCERERSRRGLTVSSSAFRSHLTIGFLLLFSMVPTFSLALFWHRSGRPLFPLIRPLWETTTDLTSPTDPELIPVLILILPMHYVWQRTKSLVVEYRSKS